MPVAHLNDIDLYYELHGTGPQTVVLLNGITMSTAAWAFQIPAIAEYFQVLVFDFRGQLQSGKPDSEAYAMSLQAADVVALLDYCGIIRAHLVGLSYGGAVAQHIAINYPDRVSRLVLADTMAWSDPVNSAIADSWDAAVRGNDATLRFKMSLPLIFGADFLTQFADQVPMMEQQSLAWDPRVLGRMLAGIRQHDVRQRLSFILAPTLVVVGEDDRFTPPYHARLLVELIKGADLALIPHCGHAAPLEQPLKFNRLVLDFLRLSA